MATFKELESSNPDFVSTQNAKLDKFFGGGCVPGHTYFLYGAPGVSKSTFCEYLLFSADQNLNNIAIFISNEQTAGSIVQNCNRFHLSSNINILGTDSCRPHVADIKNEIIAIRDLNPEKQLWVVLDSLYGIPGNDATVVNEINQFCVDNKIICFIIGQMNKRGQFLGANSVCHLIQVELEMVYTSKYIRTVIMKKNRLGESGGQIRINLEHRFDLMDPRGRLEIDKRQVAEEFLKTVVGEGKREIRRMINSGVRGVFRRLKGKK